MPLYRCVKCGYKGTAEIGHQRPNGTGECGYIAARITDVLPSENLPMAKTLAQRQADFRKAMKDAGFVLLTAYVTKEQREKFRQIGGDAWLRKKIDAAKQQSDERRDKSG